MVRCAVVAFTVMGRLGCHRWQGVVARCAADQTAAGRVRLTSDQQDDLDRNAVVLGWLQDDPLITVQACPACGRWGFTAPRPASAAGHACTYTAGCRGRLVVAVPPPRPQSRRPPR